MRRVERRLRNWIVLAAISCGFWWVVLRAALGE